MKDWARLCSDCWYRFNPTEYLPEQFITLDDCEECGQNALLYGLRVSIVEAAKDTEAHMPTTIDITPSDEAYGQIALMFVENVLGDVRKDRKRDAAALLLEAVKIVGYLAHKERGVLVKPLVEYLERASK